MNALDVSGLTLRFGAVAALNNVSFALAPNELFAVIGPNGAGKTSLFNVLTRLHDPSAGMVRYFDDDIVPLRPHQLASRGIARTFQNLGLFPYLTVLDNVLIGRSHMMHGGALRAGLRPPSSRAEEKRHAAAACEAIEFVGLGRLTHHRVAALPYGVRKRVELARALAMEPRLLLLDEPVAGMSRAERADITALIDTIRKERELAVVLVEHDMGVVMSLAQRILVLDFGRPIAVGTPQEIQRDPRVIAAYLGAVDEQLAEAPA